MSLQRSSDEVKTPITSCARCGGAMRLEFVAPSYFGRNEEVQTYQCTACGNAEALKVPLKPQSRR
jgi:DNA-directed RNA polymerase subunit M/transcription elongation factor TFIIS